MQEDLVLVATSFWGGGGHGSSKDTVAAQSGKAYGSGGGSPHSRHGGTSGAGKVL